MLWRAFIFWVRLAVRVIFWSSLMMMAAWLYSRGPDGVVEDLQNAATHWQSQYDFYQGQVDAQRKLVSREGMRGHNKRGGW